MADGVCLFIYLLVGCMSRGPESAVVTSWVNADTCHEQAGVLGRPPSTVYIDNIRLYLPSPSDHQLGHNYSIAVALSDSVPGKEYLKAWAEYRSLPDQDFSLAFSVGGEKIRPDRGSNHRSPEGRANRCTTGPFVGGITNSNTTP